MLKDLSLEHYKVNITVANKYQAYKILAVLEKAEVEGILPFAFDAKVGDEDEPKKENI